MWKYQVEHGEKSSLFFHRQATLWIISLLISQYYSRWWKYIYNFKITEQFYFLFGLSMWNLTLSYYGIPIIEPCCMIWFEPGGWARAITWWAACLQLIVEHLFLHPPRTLDHSGPLPSMKQQNLPLTFFIHPPCSHKCFFGSSLCCSQSGNDPQEEDLIARFIYKLNIKVKHPSVFQATNQVSPHLSGHFVLT